MYECNKSNLFNTVLDYSLNSLSFERKTEALDSLKVFGNEINTAFQLVKDSYEKEDLKKRVFAKVLEKITDEKSDLDDAKKMMQ